MVGEGRDVGTPLDLPGVSARTWGWGGVPLGWLDWLEERLQRCHHLKGLAVESVRGAG